MRRYLDSNGQKLQILSILIFFVMVIGIVTGSVFYMKTDGDRAAVNERFTDIFRAAAESENHFETAKNYFIRSAFYCSLIFISAYFKAGAAVSAAAVLRRGFVTGFTAAAAVGTYGAAGALIMGVTAAEQIIETLVLVIFSAVSVSYSIGREKFSKKFLIFFAVLSISIFCVISLSHGFLATTFMKWIYPKFD